MGLQFFNIGTEQNQRRQTGGRNRIAFRHRFHRVADSVELVRGCANFFRQIAHDGNPAGVVRDRAKGIE